jgi:arylsulfatase
MAQWCLNSHPQT